MDWGTLRGRNLQRLRTIVKRVHLKHYPGEHITDREADRVIETLAPDVAERMIRAVIDRKVSLAADVETLTAVSDAYTRDHHPDHPRAPAADPGRDAPARDGAVEGP